MLPIDKATSQSKKFRNRVYSLIGFYKKRGFLNNGQLYQLRQAADKIMNYDYAAYMEAKRVINQINYDFQ